MVKVLTPKQKKLLEMITTDGFHLKSLGDAYSWVYNPESQRRYDIDNRIVAALLRKKKIKAIPKDYTLITYEVL